MDESGFYRLDEVGGFQCAPNGVMAPDYVLDRALKDTYTYPTQGGWHWFDDEAQAREFFGLPEKDVTH